MLLPKEGPAASAGNLITLPSATRPQVVFINSGVEHRVGRCARRRRRAWCGIRSQVSGCEFGPWGIIARLASANRSTVHLRKGMIHLLCAVKAALECGQDLDALWTRTPLPDGRRLG
jgi:hypothetical protein